MGSLSSGLFSEAQEKLKRALQLANGDGLGFIEA
jgi:hypothetical protein